jgi:hypothetical protein
VGNRNAHAEGDYTKALGLAAHSEGANTVALGSGSHAEGFSYSSLPFSGTCDGLYLYVDENDKETLMSWLEDGILNTTRYEDLYLVISDYDNINLDTTY